MRYSVWIVTSVLILLVLVLAPLTALNAAAADAPLLYLHRGTFDARRGAPPLMHGLGEPAAEKYAIIQFRGPVFPADRQALLKTGVRLLEYVPDYAFLVEGTAPQLAAAARLPQVYARVPFTLADKLAPDLLRAVSQGKSEVGQVNVVGWPGEARQIGRDLRRLPFDVGAPLTPGQLRQMAALDSVRWIETAGQPRLLNDVARSIMGVDGARQASSLYGQGQIIGITDSGLDTGDQSTLSPDFAGRVVATQVLAVGGDWVDQHGHGTHVAGSAAGAGVQSGADPGGLNYSNSFAGVAPAAQLAIQAFEADPATGQIEGIPANYYTLFDQMYGTGARLHSNSWGDITGGDAENPEYGGYVDGTRQTDQFVWDYPDMAIFVAAGNAGVDGVPDIFCLGDGVIDPDSILSPGTAKNVITVGASESTNNSGPYQDLIWLGLGLCFWTNPIAGDPIANNSDGMAAFSSRGPTDDGRYKPDIVAPGVNIVSNRSQDPNATQLWGAYNNYYSYSGGTSMATPLTAGLGAIVRQWLQQQGAANPSAALIKATLLNTTHDMAPGQYGTGATQEIPFARPNSVNGWGRADLRFIEPQVGYGLWFDDHTAGLTTGQEVSYTHTVSRPLQVLTDTMPLRVMLTWTDYPAAPLASKQLVNDLNLTVTDPVGTVYYGNGITTGDDLNNVEGVVIDSPILGAYEIHIQASNVPSYTQPYALVVAGPIEEAVAISGLAADNDSPTPLGESTRLTAAVSAGTDVVYTWDFGDGSGGSGALEGHTYASAGQFTAVVTASNSLGAVSTSTPVTITAAPVALPGTFSKSSPSDGAANQSTNPTLSWGSSSGATSYEYCYDVTNDSACSNWTSHGNSTFLNLAGLSAGTTYYWQVRAVNSEGTTYANGSSSAFWSFTTAANPPGAFAKLAPANLVINEPTSPTLSWGSSSGATSYHYCYDTTNDSACSAWTSNDTSTSIGLTGLSPDTTYYWHVRAVNGGGTTYSNGDTAAFWSFTTQRLGSHFTDCVNTTGDNATVLIPSTVTIIGDYALEVGDEIAIFNPAGTICAGVGVWDGNNLGITVWGDDSQTTPIDGLLGGEAMAFHIWDASGLVEYSSSDVTFTQGNGIYSSNSFHIVGTLTPKMIQAMSLGAGWNMISSYVDPEDPNLSAVMGPVLDDIVLLKNGLGQVFWPAFDINQIGSWNYQDGYQLYMSNPRTLAITGTKLVANNTPIPLTAGWNMVSYLPEVAIPVDQALSSISSELLLAKDNFGRVYWPAFSINQIVNMQPGQGYQLYLTAGGTLTYPLAAAVSSSMPTTISAAAPLQHFTGCVSNTGNNATVLIPNTVTIIGDYVLEVGDEIAIFNPSGTVCAGLGTWDGSNLSITAWGDDSQTTPVDGLLGGEAMAFRIWDASGLVEYSHVNLTFAQGDGLYNGNSIHIVETMNPIVTQAITLAAGWNMISSYVDPEDPGLGVIMGAILNDMVLLKSGLGEVFWPAFGINQIGSWEYQDGYQLYMTAPRTLTITGTKLVADNTPIPLTTGWNMVSYLPDVAIPVDQALSSISGVLVLAKDNDGQVYWPAFNINQIGDMQPGQGYQLYLTAGGTLTYPAAAAVTSSKPATTGGTAPPQHFTGCVSKTGNNATMGIPNAVTIIGDYALQKGDEIAIFNPAGTICAGVGIWPDGDNNLSITVWGDDSQTTPVDGMKAGEAMQIRLWDQAADKEYQVSATYDPRPLFHSSGEYGADRFYMVESLQLGQLSLYLPLIISDSLSTSAVADRAEVSDSSR